LEEYAIAMEEYSGGDLDQIGKDGPCMHFLAEIKSSFADSDLYTYTFPDIAVRLALAVIDPESSAASGAEEPSLFTEELLLQV
jgi:hypothetical protein